MRFEMGRWTEFGGKGLIYQQKKLQINLHIHVREIQLSRRERDRKASTSASRGFEWEIYGNWRKRFDVSAKKSLKLRLLGLRSYFIS